MRAGGFTPGQGDSECMTSSHHDSSRLGSGQRTTGTSSSEPLVMTGGIVRRWGAGGSVAVWLAWGCCHGVPPSPCPAPGLAGAGWVVVLNSRRQLRRGRPRARNAKRPARQCRRSAPPAKAADLLHGSHSRSTTGHDARSPRSEGRLCSGRRSWGGPDAVGRRPGQARKAVASAAACREPTGGVYWIGERRRSRFVNTSRVVGLVLAPSGTPCINRSGPTSGTDTPVTSQCETSTPPAHPPTQGGHGHLFGVRHDDMRCGWTAGRRAALRWKANATTERHDGWEGAR